MSHVFLSFSSDNREAADQLKALMEQSGIQVWMSSYDIRPGEDFADVIPPAIEGCGCFVLLLTKEALETEWVRKELDIVFGLRPRKVVIPVQMEQVQLDAGMDFRLRNCQILTLKTFDAAAPAAQSFLAMVQDALAGKLTQRTLMAKKSPVKWIVAAIAALVVLTTVLALSDVFFSGDVDTTINQIPNKYVDEVQAVLDSTSTLDNISLKVGERVTPQEAKLWECTIYSQDTRIAVGDGKQVVGVSAGTTYIVVASKQTGMAEAYRVTVTDDGAPLLGVNQIPEHLTHHVDALKNGDKTTFTVRMKVGETKSLPMAWTDVTIYSGDTGVVVSTGQGKEMRGVAAGSAYVLVESATGGYTTYFIEVSEA